MEIPWLCLSPGNLWDLTNPRIAVATRLVTLREDEAVPKKCERDCVFQFRTSYSDEQGVRVRVVCILSFVSLSQNVSGCTVVALVALGNRRIVPRQNFWSIGAAASSAPEQDPKIAAYEFIRV